MARATLVSAVIPAYNAQETLERAVNSVLAQSYPHIEVIVINDGSTDGTSAVCKRLAQAVKVIEQSNAGASHARNVGVGLSSGDLVAFLDADDLWHPEKIRLQVEVMERDRRLTFCATKNSRVVNYEALRPVGVPDRIPIQVLESVAEVFAAPFYGTPNVMIRRNVFQAAGGFDESFKTAEDLDLWMRASQSGPVAIIDLELTTVVLMPDSLSQLSGEVYADHLKVVDKFTLANPEFLATNKSLVQRVRSDIYTAWGSEALVDQEYPEARRHFLSSLRWRFNSRAFYLLLKSLVAVVR